MCSRLLPHRFLNPKTTSVCLFVKDLDPKHDYKDHDVDKSARYFKQFLKDDKNVSGLDDVSENNDQAFVSAWHDIVHF